MPYASKIERFVIACPAKFVYATFKFLGDVSFFAAFQVQHTQTSTIALVAVSLQAMYLPFGENCGFWS